MSAQVNVPRPSGANRYQAPQMRLGRSGFDLTHSHKTTFEVGKLVPYFLMEVVPGDTVTCRLSSFVRIFSPLDAPIMDDISVEIDYFFVPNRIVWEHWDDFLGAHEQAGAQDTVYTVPRMEDGLVVEHSSVMHYMGLPIGLSTTTRYVSALPLRAYALIYDDWYRDQNLIDKQGVLVTDANGTGSWRNFDNTGDLHQSAKKHDYFTSALPYLQKGAAVTLPLGASTAPIRTNAGAGVQLTLYGSSGTSEYRFTETGTFVTREATPNAVAGPIYADLSSVTAVNINTLREAAAVQTLLERDARGGTRLPELIRAHFGVDVPDYRVQRPEYLGGGGGFINVSPVANTSDTANRDQGELAGVGTGTLRSFWAKSFVEHGHVIGILRARAQVTYQQGIDRMWMRGVSGEMSSTKYDFLWPELVNLGEQAIYKKELFVVNGAADNDVFGYQERYADYRYKRSLVSGKFASDAPGSLDFWHLAEDFSAAPTLNSTFLSAETAPMARVTTVDSEPDFIIDGRFDLRVARALPVRAVPSLSTPRF